MRLCLLQEMLGYRFRDVTLLEAALTHRSHVHETGGGCDNQRLEFLGDAILDFVMADALYVARSEAHEGELSRLRSRLVCEDALCLVAKALELGEYVRLGRGEACVGGRGRAGILADAYEAIVGAIYLDGGIEPARAFILCHHAALLADPDGAWLPHDAKTRLQELTQSARQTLRYEVVGQSGPSHAPEFTMNVWVDEVLCGTGMGRSKKDAQQHAASEALRLLGKR